MNVVRPFAVIALAIALSVGLAATAAAQATRPAPKPTPPAPPPAPAAPQAPAAPAPTNVCEYVELPDAIAFLGVDASASTAPSRGALLSCGYTSPGGNTLTVSIADYGIPSIAQQFFEKTWELTKTATVEDSLGTSGFAVIAAEPPPARSTITVLKAEKIVSIEAGGPTVGKAESLPALRAMLLKLLPKLPAAPAPQP